MENAEVGSKTRLEEKGVLEAGAEANEKPSPGIPPYTGAHHSRADRRASDDPLLGRGGTTGLPTETTNTSTIDRPL